MLGMFFFLNYETWIFIEARRYDKTKGYFTLTHTYTKWKIDSKKKVNEETENHRTNDIIFSNGKLL